MAAAYRICLIVPPGYKHSHAFLEVALLLKSASLNNGSIISLSRDGKLLIRDTLPPVITNEPITPQLRATSVLIEYFV